MTEYWPARDPNGSGTELEGASFSAHNSNRSLTGSSPNRKKLWLL